jgi:hypothetical protein
MNLVHELKNPHSLALKDKIIRYVGTNPGRFDELMTIFLGGDYRSTQWAGWPLSDIAIKHPHLIRPYLRPILKTVDKPDMHVAVKRNVMRMFQFIEIPKNLRALAFEKAMGLLHDTSEPVAVRVFAMTVMKQVAMAEPGLKNEVTIAIEEQLPYGSAAFINRAGKLIKELKR